MTDSQPVGPDHAFRPSWRDVDRCSFEALDETRCGLPASAHRFVLQPPIEIEVYKPHPEKTGYLLLDYRRTIQDVLDELNAKLKLEGREPDEYGFSNMTKYRDPAYMAEGPRKYGQYALPWPEYRRIAVFPVTGNSEGHYIHIEIISPERKDGTHTVECIGLAKTFRGWDHACRIAGAAARLLQA